MKENEDVGQSPCCEGSDCCSQTISLGNRRGNWWKTLIFSAVILLACAITAYSLFRQRPAAAGSSCCATGSAESIGIGEAATVEGLGDMVTGANLALIVFPRQGDSLSVNITATIDSLKSEIGTDSTGLRTITLYPDNPSYIVAINHYDINEYPAVLALGNNVSRVLTQTSINKNLILDLYRKSKAGSACCPTGNTPK